MMACVKHFALYGRQGRDYNTADAGRENLLSVFSDPGKFYGDDAYTFLFASVLILIFGPGKIAIDSALRRALVKKTTGYSTRNPGVTETPPMRQTLT